MEKTFNLTLEQLKDFAISFAYSTHFLNVKVVEADDLNTRWMDITDFNNEDKIQTLINSPIVHLHIGDLSKQIDDLYSQIEYLYRDKRNIQGTNERLEYLNRVRDKLIYIYKERGGRIDYAKDWLDYLRGGN